MRKIPSIPQAGMLLASLRSVGYTEEAAIADIVDNSIAAGASEIHITFSWDKKIISIVDNGKGMNQDELYKNMQIGSSNPNGVRSERDLGRFGMGMKTAAFSLGKKVTVVTCKNGYISNASWDLNRVDDIGWHLLVNDDHAYDSFLCGFENHGTAVIISTLDKLIDDADSKKSKEYFFRVIRKVENHLSLVFHRFINEDGLKIFINGDVPINGWNPFIVDNPATQELADEEIWDSENQNITYIQPYVLPHKTKFSSDEGYEAAGGYKGWNRHQGIYLYRNRHLIIYGTWFELIRKEPAFNLARIRIDISSGADTDWKIDIKKSSAAPPVYLRDRILSIITDCTKRSSKVFNSRGAYTKQSPFAPNLDFVWEQVRNNGNYTFKINKQHLLLNAVREQLNDAGRAQLKTYLTLIENFVPFMHNGLINTVNTGTAKPGEVQRVQHIAEIKSCITVFMNQGFSKKEIQETLLKMPSYAYLKDEIMRLLEEFL